MTPGSSRKVDRKFATIVVLLTVTLGGILFHTIRTIAHQKLEAVVIDLDGRQRMLHERHLCQIVSLSHGIPADYQSTRKILSETLDSLINGGPAIRAIGESAIVGLPPPPTFDIKEKLLEQQRLMRDFTTLADAFLTSGQAIGSIPPTSRNLRN